MEVGETAGSQEYFGVVGFQFGVDVDVDEVAQNVTDFGLDFEISHFTGLG